MAVAARTAPPKRAYQIRISRRIVDKLGVRLYDSISAVVAEIIANGYDADATEVTVRLPLATELARKRGAKVEEHGYSIEILDNGHGMTPDEAIDHYLEVGRDRREQPTQGARSREKKRPVMGRKGIGKLAPFGVCRRIEVLSAGGVKTAKGYLVTHFAMDYDKITNDKEADVPLQALAEDRTWRPNRGTTITLSNFLPKKVPDRETFERQLAKRFVFAKPDFAVYIEDTRAGGKRTKLDPLNVPLMAGTRVDLAGEPVPTDDGDLPVTGFLGLAKEAYQNEEMTGVRIYARGKIVATTRDFEQPAGYTGEYTTRSYLVGAVNADWLDDDDNEDLIRTDRQDILWHSERGEALRIWGAKLIKRIGAASREPRRALVRERFLERSKLEDRARARYGSDEAVVEAALTLAKEIGGFAAEDELTDHDYVDQLSEVILSVAPHRALIEAFQSFAEETKSGDSTLASLSDLFSKTRVAEMASYAQVAAERVRVIGELEDVIATQTDEAALQNLIAKAPWLIEPTWSVVSANQSLKSFKAGFERFWKDRHGTDVVLAIGPDTKRPDFTLIDIGQTLHIVEIKASGHMFDDTDCARLLPYAKAFDEFFDANAEFKSDFPHRWRIDLIADRVALKDPANTYAYESLQDKGRIVKRTWLDFLRRTKRTHEQYLQIREAAIKRAAR